MGSGGDEFGVGDLGEGACCAPGAGAVGRACGLGLAGECGLESVFVEGVSEAWADGAVVDCSVDGGAPLAEGDAGRDGVLDTVDWRVSRPRESSGVDGDDMVVLVVEGAAGAPPVAAEGAVHDPADDSVDVVVSTEACDAEREVAVEVDAPLGGPGFGFGPGSSRTPASAGRVPGSEEPGDFEEKTSGVLVAVVGEVEKGTGDAVGTSRVLVAAQHAVPGFGEGAEAHGGVLGGPSGLERLVGADPFHSLAELFGDGDHGPDVEGRAPRSTSQSTSYLAWPAGDGWCGR